MACNNYISYYPTPTHLGTNDRSKKKSQDWIDVYLYQNNLKAILTTFFPTGHFNQFLYGFDHFQLGKTVQPQADLIVSNL